MWRLLRPALPEVRLRLPRDAVTPAAAVAEVTVRRLAEVTALAQRPDGVPAVDAVELRPPPGQCCPRTAVSLPR